MPLLRQIALRVTRAAVALTFLVLPACADAQTVRVWLTTGDRTKSMEAQAALAFTRGTPASDAIVVDQSRVYQEIEGFGASFTDSAAYLLNHVASAATREAVMRRLFTRSGEGIGLGFIRNPMGASDLARTHYSYDDLPAGQTDPQLVHFSIAHDEVDIIPLVRQARALNPSLRIMATPWSPPGWMKTSGTLIGGALRPDMRGPFAQYFIKYLQAYKAAGIPVDYISLQNEPLYVPANYPGMSMDGETQRDVLRDFVLPALAGSGLATRVLVYDHNWDRPDYPETVFADPVLAASSVIAGTAWHGYGGTPEAMAKVRERFPSKGAYQTEHSGGTWVTDQLREDFDEIINVLRNDGRAFVKWSLVLDEHRGPFSGGCDTCSPLVTVGADGSAVNTVDFYTLGHFSRFMLAGARRIASTNIDGIAAVAALNPDGSIALVAFNDTLLRRTFAIRWGELSFTYTLAGHSGATFTWNGTPQKN